MGMLLVPFFDVIALVVNIYFKIVVVEIVIYWLLHFKLISANNKYAVKFVDILKKATEPVYKKIRAKVPPFADFDASPFILLLAIFFVARMLDVLREMVM
ncbi:MAG: YggT family protein [Alphaproteobacteria bacterium]|nr:YggT family protein [Alphaproteobacteria bacterium]